MKCFVCFVCMAFSIAAYANKKVEIDRSAAQDAFIYLNEVRQNPKKYISIHSSLKDVEPSVVLTWNDTLARLAEARATDMAKNNYFSHVNKHGEGIDIQMIHSGYSISKAHVTGKYTKAQNSFESIEAGDSTGVEAVNSLIIDKNMNPPAHRCHLLSMLPFYKKNTDIGIGFVRSANSEYKTYICIIIAHHD